MFENYQKNKPENDRGLTLCELQILILLALRGKSIFFPKTKFGLYIKG